MREPLNEDLVAELTRLVGRPQPVLEEALARFLDVLARRAADAAATRRLARFPLTAWRQLAGGSALPGELWTAVASAGLGDEEVFTALAVIDDHLRRRYGCHCWGRVEEWLPRMALRARHAGAGTGAEGVGVRI